MDIDAVEVSKEIQQALAMYSATPEVALAASGRALAALAGQEGSLLHTRALRARGRALHRSGRHQEAISCLTQALAAVPPEEADLRVRVLIEMAIGYHFMGSVLDELYSAQRALEEARKRGGPELVWFAQTAMAAACDHCGDSSQAHEHCLQILSYQEGLPVPRPVQLATALGNLASVQMKLGRPADALTHFNRAISIEQLPLALLQGITGGLAEVLHALGRSSEAVDVLTSAARSLRRDGHPFEELSVRMSLGRLLQDLGQSEEAIVEFNLALEVATKIGTSNHVCEAHERLACAYKTVGPRSKVIEHLEACLLATRDANTLKQTTAMAEMRAQLEVSEATHRAEVSHLRNVELAQAHERLQSAHEALRAAEAERTILIERLETQSRTDPLTGLANRRELDARLGAEIERFHRHAMPLTVSMCDIDHFKQVNDRFSHTVGDEVLRSLATILRTQCRELDIAARYGGEEFCLVFPQTAVWEASQVCERIRLAVASFDWASINPDLKVTLSMGVAGATELQTVDCLLGNADAAMYRAKRNGRNQVCVEQFDDPDC